MIRRLGVIVGVGLAALIAMPAAVAQSETVSLEVEAGFDGLYRRGMNLPVTVVVSATRPIEGELLVSARSQGVKAVHSLPIELAAGSRKRVSLIYPQLFPNGLRVRFRAEGLTLAEERLDLAEAGDGTLVGSTAPDVAIASVDLATHATANEIHLTPLAEEILDLGAPAFEALDHVLVGEEAATLSEDQKRSLLLWTRSGGRLILAVEDPDEAGWVPEARGIAWERSGDGWTPRSGYVRLTQTSSGAETSVGLGRIVVVPTTPAQLITERTFFEKDLIPATLSMRNPWDAVGSQSAHRIADALAPDNVSRVRLGGLVGFLLGYVVLIGPINYLLLRRRGRKELAWITIPLAALLFSGVAYGLVRQTGGDRRVRHGTVVFASQQDSRGRTTLSLTSGAGGDHRVQFPSDLAAAAFGGPFGVGTSLVRHLENGAEVKLETSPFSVAVAQGDTDAFEGFIDARVELGPDSITGTVTNRTDYELFEVQVRLGTQEILVGRLVPGASKGISAAPVGPERGFRQQPFGTGGPLRNALGTNLNAVIPNHGIWPTPVVTAFTRQFSPSVRIDEAILRPLGATIVASPLTIDVVPAGGRIPGVPGSVRLVDIDGSVHVPRPGSLFLEGFREATFSYELTPPKDGAMVADLTIGASGGGAFDVEAYDWKADDWLSLDQIRMNGRLQTVRIPSEGLTPDGRGFVRFRRDGPPFMDVYYTGIQGAAA